MGFLAVSDVIASKIFGSAIPITNDIVKYFMVPTCFCLLGTVQLNGGLMQVDLFSRKYGPHMKKIFGAISGVLGFAVFGFCGWKTSELLIRHIQRHEMSAASAFSFPLWPLSLLCVVGTFVLAFAFVWTTLRLFLAPAETDTGAEHQDET